jgi:hypothetical protein
MPKPTTQTTRLNGKRVILKTSAAGKVTITAALPLEWQLQASQVRALRNMPEYGKQFLLASGMEAGKRGSRATVEAQAAGMTAGNPDLTIYLPGGRVRMIENKVGAARLEESQRVRHPALAAIGHPVTIVRATTEADAAQQAVALVRGWLAGNDNSVAGSFCVE